jgi:hypothetical protein
VLLQPHEHCRGTKVLEKHRRLVFSAAYLTKSGSNAIKTHRDWRILLRAKYDVAFTLLASRAGVVRGHKYEDNLLFFTKVKLPDVSEGWELQSFGSQ